ncbi:UDP-N-acetylmuramoyl-tripeptide--D-alanyl-D-alanine ligase [Hydrogenoanaerobacterium sp.]|uniref:UDP-N-acetylmuramoyl-tripeptide--D-alanyl-D- alanine ligase n=1 Tax=Hydrogenoanaerobacterium sp. TaxID=2953763 RepID=UPI00289FF05C|nr:UDP-N-acetylmuramoyl-tripeptide--D-alanyl-D-alanine ligase [Hydrogenoanaerobacterium sp.]
MDIKLSLSAICEVICADKKLFGEISYITTDSRDIRPGCLFIALRGENFDGHNYIGSALLQGAQYAVAEMKGDYPKDRVLYVGSTEKALRRIALLYRNQLSAKIVAVTGSVGKTTTRDMTAAVLSAGYKTIKTEGNLNNQIGVPKTLLGIESSHEAAVVEMGMSGFGEIEELSLCAQPDAAIITNIGLSHILRLGSREGIYRAKTEIAAGLKAGAPLILNGDDDLLASYRNPRFNVVYFGIENPDCAVRAENIAGTDSATSFTIVYGGRRIPAEIPTIGKHNVLNALAGFTAGVLMGVLPEAAAKALAGFSPTGMRQKIVDCRGITIVEDCYNASPDSFVAALNTLKDRSCTGRRILIAADMLELGAISSKAHYNVGVLAGKLGIDAVYAYGEMSKHTIIGAEDGGVADAKYFDSKRKLSGHLIANAKKGDVLWFKASRGMKLEDVIQTVYEERRK